MTIKLLAATAAILVSTAAQAIVPGTLGPASSGYRLRVALGDGLPFVIDHFEAAPGPGAASYDADEPLSGSSGFVDGFINYGANPTVSALVSTSGFGLASANIGISYDFLVTAADQADFDNLFAYLALDPSFGFTVTGKYGLNVTGFGSTDASGSAIIDAGFGEVLFKCTPGGGECTGGVSTPYTTVAAATADLATLSFSGRLRLGVDAFVATTGGTQSAYAMIDPVISLPQGFGGNPGSYVVAYSANLAAVPEPASWAMMIAGFGLVGAVRRRHRVAAT